MKFFFALFCCVCTTALFAHQHPVDRNASSYSVRKQTKRVDLYDFSGEFPNLEDIDIDAKRKKKVEVNLSGHYPLLEQVTIDGGFGTFDAQLTGHFPKLTMVSLLLTKAAIDVDLRGTWEKSCLITVRGMEEGATLYLPHDVGVVVHTKTGIRGKTKVTGLKKSGWFKHSYANELAETAPVVLNINIEMADGRIHLISEAPIASEES